MSKLRGAVTKKYVVEVVRHNELQTRIDLITHNTNECAKLSISIIETILDHYKKVIFIEEECINVLVCETYEFTRNPEDYNTYKYAIPYTEEAEHHANFISLQFLTRSEMKSSTKQLINKFGGYRLSWKVNRKKV